MLTDMERVGVPVACESYLPEIEKMALQDHEKHRLTFMEWCDRVCPGASRMNPASDSQKQALLFLQNNIRRKKEDLYICVKKI